jgi:hypothetical protein
MLGPPPLPLSLLLPRQHPLRQQQGRRRRQRPAPQQAAARRPAPQWAVLLALQQQLLPALEVPARCDQAAAAVLLPHSALWARRAA